MTNFIDHYRRRQGRERRQAEPARGGGTGQRDRGGGHDRLRERLEGKALVLTDGELELLRDLTIDGDRNNDGREVTLSGGFVSRILHVTGANTDAHIRDLTLTHGSATGGGGAIFADDGTALRLDQVAIRDNNAPPDEGGSGYFGGGVWALGNLALRHCTVTGNFASYGGGIAARNLTMNNTTISGNSAHAGGGIHSSGEVKLTDSTISGNSTFGNYGTGEAINSFGSVAIANSTISGNSTTGSFAGGGGVFVRYGRVDLTNSTVSNNSVAGDYAAAAGFTATMTPL